MDRTLIRKVANTVATQIPALALIGKYARLPPQIPALALIGKYARLSPKCQL